MFGVLLAVMLGLGQAGAKSAALPDTPQGKHVASYIEAFNSGDEKTFLAWYEKHVAKEVLQRRSVEERAKMFQRMRGDFGKLVVTSVAKATAQQIQIVIPTADGQGQGTFTFDFEAEAPYKISGLGIEVGAGRP